MTNLTETPGAENHLVATTGFDPSLAYSHLHLPSGEQVAIPTSLLLSFQAQPSMALSTDAQAPARPVATEADVLDSEPLDDNLLVLPVAEEQLTVGKRVVARETVRLQRSVETHVQTAEVELEDVSWQMQRIPKDIVVSAVPEVRTEGETTIYPVVGERAVVTRQLVLLEEVHVTRQTSTRREIVEATLRRGKLNVERIPARQP